MRTIRECEEIVRKRGGELRLGAWPIIQIDDSYVTVHTKLWTSNFCKMANAAADWAEKHLKEME